MFQIKPLRHPIGISKGYCIPNSHYNLPDRLTWFCRASTICTTLSYEMHFSRSRNMLQLLTCQSHFNHFHHFINIHSDRPSRAYCIFDNEITGTSMKSKFYVIGCYWDHKHYSNFQLPALRFRLY